MTRPVPLTALAVLLLASALGAGEEASAADPRYNDRSLWPASAAAADFAKETWPTTRTLVWARPGVGKKGLKADDADAWLENGKPATAPFDENTDLVLPPAETKYKVTVETSSKTRLAVRHLTVGRNAGFAINWGGVTGNVWAKEGGTVEISKALGGKHTFFRQDGGGEPPCLSGDFTINKSGGASVEFLGRFRLGDRLFVKCGRMIIGEDAAFRPGSRDHRTPIYPEGELILLSGATLDRWENQGLNLDLVVAGKLWAGMPERPIARDCFIGLSAKIKDLGKGNAASYSTPKRGDDRGFVLLKDGDLQVHSADPATARLVFKWHGVADEKHDALLAGAKRPLHKVSIVLQKGVSLNGVLFDDVEEGGIELADPANRSTWKNVFFGKNNAAAPDALFVKHPEGVPYVP